MDQDIDRLLRAAGRAYTSDQFDECVKLCEQLLQRLSPDDPRIDHVRHILADAFIDLHRFQEAVDTLSLIIATRPTPVAHANRGWALMALRRWDDAFQDYQIAVQRNPLDIVAVSNLAECLCALSRHDDAIALLANYRYTPEQCGRIYRFLGDAHATTGDIAEAYNSYVSAVKFNPDDVYSQSCKEKIERAVGRERSD